MTNDDMELVRQYVANQSESAFAALVSRHTNLVYSTALRRIGNPQQTEEITQAVFIILARKAGSLNERTILPSWLYRTACYVSGHAFRQELRRQRCEQEAFMQSRSNQTESEAWPQIMPLLEVAMLRLSQPDRDALVLRFFEGRSLNEVGVALGASEEAAKKRVQRAVEKLRQFFITRGVVIPAPVFAAAISANSIKVAPVTLAKAATAAAVAKGAMAPGSTLTLVKGALKIMAWTKAQTAIVIGAAAILAAGTVATVEVHRQHAQTQAEFPRSSWAAAGYADPVSSFETGLWAAAQGDGKKLIAGCSPRMLGDTTAKGKVAREMQAQGKSLSPEEIFAQTGTIYVEGVTGFRILDKTTSGDQAILHLLLEGREEKQTVTMKKIREEWMIDDIQ